MAQKALSLLEVAEDFRSQTRLRIQLGVLHLQSDPPLPHEALTLLDQAQADGSFASLNDADRSRIKVASSRARFILGDHLEAAAILAELDDSGVADALLAGIEALILRAQICGTQGRPEESIEHLRAAATRLSQLGYEHGVAQLWFEVGSLLDEHDLYREAAIAFRSAGATTGLSKAASAQSNVMS